MSRGRMLGAILLATGLVGAAIGTTILVRSRSRAGLGRAQSGPRSRSGMVLTHHRGRMPIQRRVAILQDLTWKSVQDPEMRKLALGITRGCPARDDLCETRAVYDWVRKNIRYTGDVAPVKMGSTGPVEGVDLYQTARRTVEFGGGDCDDQSVLTATLLTLNGIPAKFRITAASKTEGWSHIYPMAGIPKMGPNRWVAVDTTLPGDRFGKEAPYGKKVDFPA